MIKSNKATWKDGRPAKLVRVICDGCDKILFTDTMYLADYITESKYRKDYCSDCSKN